MTLILHCDCETMADSQESMCLLLHHLNLSFINIFILLAEQWTNHVPLCQAVMSLAW